MGPRVIIRHRPGGKDDLGDPLPETAPPRRYDDVTVYPHGSAEDAGRSATIITGYTAILADVDADILASDLIEWLGDTYEVDGRPGKWFHLDGSPGGLQVSLKLGED